MDSEGVSLERRRTLQKGSAVNYRACSIRHNLIGCAKIQDLH